jgi:hypothetical protein
MTEEEFEATETSLPNGWAKWDAEDRIQYIDHVEWVRDHEAFWQAQDDAMALSDPTQPEYYSTYERIYGEPAPDWAWITWAEQHPQLAREAECE